MHIINQLPDTDPIVLPHLRTLHVCVLHVCLFSVGKMVCMLRAFPMLMTFRLNESLPDILDLLGCLKPALQHDFASPDAGDTAGVYIPQPPFKGSLRRMCVLNTTLGEPPTDLDNQFCGHHCCFHERLVIVLNFWLINLFIAVITNTFSAIPSETKKSVFGTTNLTPIVPYSLEDT
ncbi:hypothetical protein C8R44DRAFT_895706 [Mycena epipterygia]|nr:hypothetical protein C8R44DRAFT_895706 [Mycena epipterygia]